LTLKYPNPSSYFKIQKQKSKLQLLCFFPFANKKKFLNLSLKNNKLKMKMK
jgi:hypothetical protein